MKFKALLVLAAALAVAAAADAQRARGQGVALSKKEIQAGLFGVDMSGYSPTYGISWRECIDVQGKTLYHTPLGVQKGRLRVSDQGIACFSYDDTDYKIESCYRVERNGKGFIFRGEADELFVSTRLVTGVKTCRPDELTS